MYYRVKLLPVRERTLRQFTAPNPWNGKSAEEWSVEQFQMVPKSAVKRGVTPAMTCRPGTPATVKGSYGLRSDSDGSIRMFPVGLTKAWVQKEAPDAALPEILHKLPKLKRTDFERPVAATFLLCILCIAAFCLGLAAIILPGALHERARGERFARRARLFPMEWRHIRIRLPYRRAWSRIRIRLLETSLGRAQWSGFARQADTAWL
jgi:hypothetical protein